MKKNKLFVLVGPPGSGKSTCSKELFYSNGLHTVYISQDSQGKVEHMSKFRHAIAEGKDIILDRMNFNKEQRARYIEPARSNGYEVEIMVLHEPYDVCLERMLKRENHPTIKNEESARSALKLFFSRYEKPDSTEADKLTFRYPKGKKFPAIICDLDGTLCDLTDRRKYVVGEGKKNWRQFFAEIENDKPYEHVANILMRFRKDHQIVFCSGRPDEHEHSTKRWLGKHVPIFRQSPLYMRTGGDFRSDDIVKENLLDFEILTRFDPYFILDDRNNVVSMWRRRGYPCLQVNEGDF